MKLVMGMMIGVVFISGCNYDSGGSGFSLSKGADISVGCIKTFIESSNNISLKNAEDGKILFKGKDFDGSVSYSSDQEITGYIKVSVSTEASGTVDAGDTATTIKDNIIKQCQL